MKIFSGILLVIHGLIVSAQSSTSFKPIGGPSNPACTTWFPANLDQSRLFTKLKPPR